MIKNWIDEDKLMIRAEVFDPAVIAKIDSGEYDSLSMGYVPKLLHDGSVVHHIQELSICSEPYFNNCSLVAIRAAAKAIDQRVRSDSAAQETDDSSAHTKPGLYIPLYASISTVVPTGPPTPVSTTSSDNAQPEQHITPRITSTPTMSTAKDQNAHDIAEVKAEMEKMRALLDESNSEKQKLTQSLKEKDKLVTDLHKDFTERNRPRYEKTTSAFKAALGKDLPEAVIADNEKIFGNQQFAAYSDFLESVANNMTRQNSEMEKMQGRYADLEKVHGEREKAHEGLMSEFEEFKKSVNEGGYNTANMSRVFNVPSAADNLNSQNDSNVLPGIEASANRPNKRARTDSNAPSWAGKVDDNQARVLNSLNNYTAPTNFNLWADRKPKF